MENLPNIVAAAYFAVFAIALLWNAASNVFAGLYALHEGKQPDDPLPSAPKVVVTLVHGTWARRATWTMSGSPLRDTLSRVVNAPIAFTRFVWSGRNSISARQRAVKDLTEHLRSLITRWPQAHHYVVAHSHGGNVAFQVLADPLLQERVAGIACLATPFLTVAKRNLGPVGHTTLRWLPVVVIFYSGLWVIVKIASPNNVALSATLFFLLFLVTILSYFLSPRLYARFSQSVLEALQYPTVDSSKILILRVAGDEATAALGTTHMISWVAGQIWLLTSRLLGQTEDTVEQLRIQLIRHWRKMALIAACLVFVCVAALLKLPPMGGRIWLQLMAPSILLLLAVFAILVKGGLVAGILSRFLFTVIATPFLILISILGIGIGLELVIAGFLFQVTAEPTPPGTWQVSQIVTEGFKHSASHHCPAALEIVGRWISDAEHGLTQ